jgi:hypothetical protein
MVALCFIQGLGSSVSDCVPRYRLCKVLVVFALMLHQLLQQTIWNRND